MHQSYFLFFILLFLQISVTVCSHKDTAVEQFRYDVMQFGKILTESVDLYSHSKKLHVQELAAQHDRTYNPPKYSYKDRQRRLENKQKILHEDLVITMNRINKNLTKLPKNIRDEFQLKDISAITYKDFQDGIQELYDEINEERTERYEDFEKNYDYFTQQDQSMKAQTKRKFHEFEKAFDDKLINCISDIKTDDGL